jgi:hypothetical protein
MNKTILTAVVCSIALLAITGCYSKKVVNFGNGTDSKIRVVSLNSGKEVEIAPSRFKNLPHGDGNLWVKTESDKQILFTDISFWNLPRPYYQGHGRIYGRLIIYTVRLEPDMQLYLAKPGARTVDKSMQPAGYPKAGQPLHE